MIFEIGWLLFDEDQLWVIADAEFEIVERKLADVYVQATPTFALDVQPTPTFDVWE